MHEYDGGHVTKPARSCLNVPIMSPEGGVNPNFASQVHAIHGGMVHSADTLWLAEFNGW